MEDDQLNLFYEVKDKVEDDSNTRVCRKCNERKMLTSFFFPVDSGSSQGHKHTCKECVSKARVDLSCSKEYININIPMKIMSVLFVGKDKEVFVFGEITSGPWITVIKL